MRRYFAILLVIFGFSFGYTKEQVSTKAILHVLDPFMDVLSENKKYIGLILKDREKDLYISECLDSEKIVGVYSSTEEAYKAIINNCGI